MVDVKHTYEANAGWLSVCCRGCVLDLEELVYVAIVARAADVAAAQLSTGIELEQCIDVLLRGWCWLPQRTQAIHRHLCTAGLHLDTDTHWACIAQLTL